MAVIESHSGRPYGLLLASSRCDEGTVPVHKARGSQKWAHPVMDRREFYSHRIVCIHCIVSCHRRAQVSRFLAPLRPLSPVDTCRNRPQATLTNMYCHYTKMMPCLLLPIAPRNLFPQILQCCWFCFKKSSHRPAYINVLRLQTLTYMLQQLQENQAHCIYLLTDYSVTSSHGFHQLDILRFC
jgi:hypothetical protein